MMLCRLRPALKPSACRRAATTACLSPRPPAPRRAHQMRVAASNLTACISPLDRHLCNTQRQRGFASRTSEIDGDEHAAGVRLSTLLSRHLGLSRRQSERMILTERVTLFGKQITNPAFVLRPSSDPRQDSSSAMKVDGKLVQGVDRTLRALYEEQKRNEGDSFVEESSSGAGKRNATAQSAFSNTRVWLANKLRGELVTEGDPVGRPSMLQRLVQGGVGKSARNKVPTHLKPVGRLDMMTEGLMIFTNDGKYARELELPGNNLWRTYRVRVHGRLTPGKLKAMRQGLTVRVNDHPAGGEDRKPSGEVVRSGRMMKYKGVKVSIERQRGRNASSRGTNTWLRITCTEGKNRQIRRILGALGLDATRLIRISYGDYGLNTIPPGRAVEVPCKGLDQKKRGPLFRREKNSTQEDKEENAPEVQWVNYS